MFVSKALLHAECIIPPLCEGRKGFGLCRRAGRIMRSLFFSMRSCIISLYHESLRGGMKDRRVFAGEHCAESLGFMRQF